MLFRPKDPAIRFETLLQPVLDDLMRFARRITRDPIVAEDLLHDALIVGLRKLSQLERDEAFRGWMNRIVYRTWLNRRRARSEAWNVVWLEVDRDVRTAAVPGPERATEQRRLGQRLSTAVQRLPDCQREAVWLVDGLGFGFGEVAEILGVPQGTIASRVCRARRALRGQLQSDAPSREVV